MSVDNNFETIPEKNIPEWAATAEVGDRILINGHPVILRDPEGSLLKKFECQACGAWEESLHWYEVAECPNSP